MDLLGNVNEYYVCLHSTAASNVLTRIWGNGAVDSNGEHDVSTWPAAATTNAASVNTNLIGLRGGSWQTNTLTHVTTSSRQFVYTAPEYAGSNLSGGRGGR